MKRNIEVLQNDLKDCASSCLLSIIRFYGNDASHEELTFLLKTTNNGTNAFNIIEGAKKLGFDGYGIRHTFDEIISSKVIFPIIAHVEKYNMYHFIVLYSVNEYKKSIKIMDPGLGLINISYEEFKNMYLNTSIIIYPVKKIECKKNIKIISYIKKYMFLEYKNIVRIVLLSFLVTLLLLISNYVTKIIVDNLLVNYEYLNVIIISLFFLTILFSKSVISFFRNNILIKYNYKVSIRMFNDTINHILNLPYYFFKNKSTGEVISRINDFKELNNILSDALLIISSDVVLIVLSMIILMIINMKLFAIVFLSMIIYLLLVIVYSRSIKKSISGVRIEDGIHNQIMTESIEGYESNKNINMINYISKKISVSYIKYNYKVKNYEFLINNQSLLKDILISIMYILVMFFGVFLVNNNELTLGSLLLFNSIMIYFTDPIKNILDLEPNISHIKSIYNRINDLMLVNSKFINETDNMISGDIVIKDLYYSYNNYNSVFDNVDLYIKYGSKFLLYGDSGCGKSTILKILLKYLNDYKGSIHINNINIKDIDESIILSSFVYVSQNSYLINDTLKNNIVYDRLINDEEYEKIINICHVNKIRDTKILRDNYLVEENGFNLSGGERQKIVLARSLLKESNYIILDEALSEVGFEEEKEIMNKIMQYFSDKTIIYISHKKEIIELFKNKYYLERSKQ